MQNHSICFSNEKYLQPFYFHHSIFTEQPQRSSVVDLDVLEFNVKFVSIT